MHISELPISRPELRVETGANKHALRFLCSANRRKRNMKYFECEVPVGDALCSDNDCPCPEVHIPRGFGYLYIDKELVEFRSKHPRESDAERAKRTQIELEFGGMGFLQVGGFFRTGPILMCEQGAKLRHLDLETAAADAAYWWKTGKVPLRSTPLDGEVSSFSGKKTETTVLKHSKGTRTHPKTRTIHIGDGVHLELVRMLPGSFMMGSPANEIGRFDDEGPQRRVRISRGFWIGKYPVTQRQYEYIMGENPSCHKAGKILGLFGGQMKPDHPVENVSWIDAVSFCKRLRGRLKGNWGDSEVRLPTESEWEYACRAGTTSALYNGKELSSTTYPRIVLPLCSNLDEIAWCGRKNIGFCTKPVGQKQPNAWGLYDMLGNVWEWCEDWFGPYPSGPVTDPTGPSSGSSRVLRGGSWHHLARHCRSASRTGLLPGISSNRIGFRVVIQKKKAPYKDPPEKIAERELWVATCQEDTREAYQRYLSKSRLHLFDEDAKEYLRTIQQNKCQTKPSPLPNADASLTSDNTDDRHVLTDDLHGEDNSPDGKLNDIRFNCPQCSQHLAADNDMKGAEIECPKCKSTILIPTQIN